MTENIWEAVHSLMRELGYKLEKITDDLKEERIIFVKSSLNEGKVNNERDKI